MNTIYYCQDDQSKVNLLQNDLEMSGYRVQVVKSGVELNRLLALDTPDLILLDILLDGKNGFEVCADLHTRKGSCPPVMILAGVYSRAGFRDEAKRVGAVEYISSEFSRLQVLDLVTNLLGGEAQGRSAA